MHLLKNQIMGYAWGSTTDIAEFLGMANENNEPMAELWMGAHPKAPSYMPGLDMDLAEFIAGDPKSALGEGVADAFGGKLPFLFKILAAGSPLSIQAHPNKLQAEAGWKRENALSIPVDDPVRNYHDDNHKPEIICSLTDFWALRGFRDRGAIVRDLSKAGGQVGRTLAGHLEDSGYKVFFESLLSLSESDRHDIIEAVTRYAESREDPGEADRYRWITRLSADYPTDIGIICPLVLNLVMLKPGQAMYLPAGELHGYLSGLGIELMANSDNVLRGGLTQKHIDIPELLNILRFEPTEPEILLPAPAGGSEMHYRTPVREFRLTRIDITAGEEYTSPVERSAEILCCMNGDAVLRSDGQTIQLSKGSTVFIAAEDPAYTVSGSVRIYKASVPV